MADKKIPGLNTHDTPTAEDLLIIVDDPTGNPVNKKIRVDTLLSALSTDTTTRSVANKIQSRADTNVSRDLNLRNTKTVLQPEILKGELDDATITVGTLDILLLILQLMMLLNGIKTEIQQQDQQVLVFKLLLLHRP